MPSASDAEQRLFSPPFVRILVMQCCFGLCWSTYLLLPKFMASELLASGSQIGLVLGIPAGVGALLVPFVGRALDRSGRRPVVIAGNLCMLAYAVGFLWVDRVGPYLYALQLLQGAAFTLTFNGAGTLSADLCPPEKLGQAMGVFGASNVVTNALAPSLAEVIEQQHGWSAAFLAPIAAASVALLLALRLREPAAEEHGERTAQAGDSILTAALYDMAIMLASGATFATVFTFYQPYALSLGVSEVRGFFIGFTAAVIAMRVGLGSAFDRLGRRRVAIASAALYVLAVLGVSELTADTLMWIGASYGIAHGIFYPTMNALAVEGVPRAERGRAMAFFNGGFQIGYAVCVAAVGPIADRFGYRAAFFVGAGLAMVAFVLVCLRRGRRAPAPLPAPSTISTSG